MLAAMSVVSVLVCLVRFDGTLETAGYAVAMATGLVLAVIDVRHRVIPRAVLYPGAAVCATLLSAAALVDGRPAALLAAAGGMAGCLIAFFVLHLLVPTGMGFGDVRLAAFVGGALGWLSLPSVLTAMVATFLIAALASAIARALASLAPARLVPVRRGSTIPFAPFLVLGAMAAVAVSG